MSGKSLGEEIREELIRKGRDMGTCHRRGGSS
jgi:hypothetical protein